MTRKENAIAYFKEGYNCSQAVVLSFKDELNMDDKSLLLIASSFGGGMGRLREVCGAVSGMFIVAGLLMGYSTPNAKLEKTEHYKRIQELANEFREKNKYIVCRDLLGISGGQPPTPDARTKEYYKKRPCADLVGDAAEIVENYLVENGKVDRMN